MLHLRVLLDRMTRKQHLMFRLAELIYIVGIWCGILYIWYIGLQQCIIIVR